jgi:DNA invertase Pin-like site-specific DNA recombinase
MLMRAGLYCRVSSEEQVEGFSLDAQRRLLEEACISRGWSVAETYVDEGKSARGDAIAKRPAFKRMMEDVEVGLLDVVVVHKLDRFARNIRVTFEYLELLARHNVKFVAVAQDVDYTKPEGRMFMGMLATLAQYYSDNLAQETKKGKAERKAQGLYNGPLPFGMRKGDDGVPVADPATIAGLRMAVELAAEGSSDRAIAQALNAAGYRTHGTHGSNLFTKDTVRAMLLNRFYLGELPGERPASAAPVRHTAVIDHELWEAAQAMREQRATQGRATVPQTATVYSLSGLAVCAQCGSHLHIQPAKGRPHLYCSGRRQGKPCGSRSAALAGYDAQLADFLGAFVIPKDYQARLHQYVAKTVPDAREDAAEQRRRLEVQGERLRDLYVLGDLDKGYYLAERERLKRELALLDVRMQGQTARLSSLAGLLANVAAAWVAAQPEQRNRLARLLFEEVVINDDRVAAVKPRPELAGFFLLDFQARAGLSREYRTSGPDGRQRHIKQVAQVA